MNHQIPHHRSISLLVIVMMSLIVVVLLSSLEYSTVHCKITLSPKASYVPVYIMMPLDSVNNDGSLNNPTKIYNNLKQVKQVGTDG